MNAKDTTPKDRFDSIPVRFGYKRTHIYVFHLVTTIRIIGLGRINCTN